jgi:hypothetical protein
VSLGVMIGELLMIFMELAFVPLIPNANYELSSPSISPAFPVVASKTDHGARVGPGPRLRRR